MRSEKEARLERVWGDEKGTGERERGQKGDDARRRTKGWRDASRCCFYLPFDRNRIEQRAGEKPRQKDFALPRDKIEKKNATVIQLKGSRVAHRRDEIDVDCGS